MHQTTVRFSADLWAELELEAKRRGVSAAQYVRDSTLARLAYTAGQRGDQSAFGQEPAAATEDLDPESLSSAVWAQARLARERARSIRATSKANHSLLREVK